MPIPRCVVSRFSHGLVRQVPWLETRRGRRGKKELTEMENSCNDSALGKRKRFMNWRSRYSISNTQSPWRQQEDLDPAVWGIAPHRTGEDRGKSHSLVGRRAIQGKLGETCGRKFEVKQVFSSPHVKLAPMSAPEPTGERQYHLDAVVAFAGAGQRRDCSECSIFWRYGGPRTLSLLAPLFFVEMSPGG